MVASKVDVLVVRAFAIAIKGTWTESVSLLIALEGRDYRRFRPNGRFLRHFVGLLAL